MAKYKIVYAPKFWRRLDDLLNYLTVKWNLKTTDNFLIILFEHISQLEQNPKIGRIAQKDKSIRSINITKHNRLYFQLKDNVIRIITLFDTRQSPAKNKFE